MTVTIRREVNLINEPILSSTVATSNLQYPGPSCPATSVNSADYSGTLSGYFEIVAKNVSGTNENVILSKDESNPMTPAWTTAATITVDANTANWTRFRTAFSSAIDDSNIYYIIQVQPSDAAEDVQILCARIVITQTVADATDLIKSVGQFEIGAKEIIDTTGTTQPLNEPKYFQYTDANWATGSGAAGCSQVDWFISVVYSGDAMSGGLNCYLERSTDFTNWTQAAIIFEGGAGTKPTYIETSIPSSGIVDTNWYRISFGGGMEPMGFWNAHMIAKQIGTTGNPLLKTEDSYLMVNAAQLDTGPQEFYTLFDSSTDEWEGIANEYYHQIDCSSNADEIHVVEQGSSVAETGSSVQGALNLDHGAKGSSMTLDTTTGDTLDCFIDVVG